MVSSRYFPVSESPPRSADHRDSQQPTSEAEKEDEGKNKLESLAESFFRQRQQQQQTQPLPDDDGEGSPEDGDDAASPPDGGESCPTGEEVSGRNLARPSVCQWA